MVLILVGSSWRCPVLAAVFGLAVLCVIFPAYQVLKEKLLFFHAEDKAPWLPAVALPLRLEELHLLGFVVIKCRGSSWHWLLPSVCASYWKQGLVFPPRAWPVLGSCLQGFSCEDAR